MKKTVWMLSAMLLLLLTSCIENDGYTYTGTFARIVTIDHIADPPRFVCDYTNEVIECVNIKTDSDLEPFNLKNAKRALVFFYYEANYEANLITLTKGDAIDPVPLWCKALPKDKTFNPVYGFNRMQVENGWAYPYGWVSNGYLNLVPVLRADETTVPYLAPAGVNGDTLKFNLYMNYALGENNRAEYFCFDLRNLTDTVSAEPKFRPWMKEMTDLMLNRDTVMVCVWADYQSNDAITKVTVPTAHFRFNPQGR
jgi:hypothetical protein